MDRNSCIRFEVLAAGAGHTGNVRVFPAHGGTMKSVVSETLGNDFTVASGNWIVPGGFRMSLAFDRFGGLRFRQIHSIISKFTADSDFRTGPR